MKNDTTDFADLFLSLIFVVFGSLILIYAIIHGCIDNYNQCQRESVEYSENSIENEAGE